MNIKQIVNLASFYEKKVKYGEFTPNRAKQEKKSAHQNSFTRLKNNQKARFSADSQTQHGLCGLRGMRGLSGVRTRGVRLAEYGRSMVEMLGVLAVIGVLSVAGIAGYRYAMTMYRANETVHEINLRAYAIAPIADNNTTDPENPEIVMEMGNITNLGYPITAYWLEDPKYFEIEVQNVPVAECKMILRTEWTLPIIMKVGDLAYDGNTSICDGLTETGEPTTTAVMVFQYGAHLEDDMLPYQECHNDDDCASKCARCSAEGVCVSICGSNERCRQDILTGSQVCCTSDRWAGPYCCPSTMNGYCCNVAGDQCCPWFKPLIDKNGNCYTCEEETGVDVTGVNENCNACPNREVWNNKCVLPCGENEIRGDNGKCYSCSEPKPIGMNDAVNKCTSICPNRVANGIRNTYCSIPCGEGFFTGTLGDCYSCSEPKNVQTLGLTHSGCETCSERTLVDNYCILLCPDGKIRGNDGGCYSCTEPNPIPMATPTLCSKTCPNRMANGYQNNFCSLPCPADTFTGYDGKCYSCNEEKNITVQGVKHTGCEQCNNRYQVGNYCILDCQQGQIRGDDGVCYDCDNPNPIKIMSAESVCVMNCPNRIVNGGGNAYCSLPCSDETFTGRDGKCYSCDEGKNIDNWDVQHDGCERCPDTRNKYNNYCVPKCPADAPLRGWDNKCYPCDTEERVNVQNITDACMECYEERTLDGNYCVLK